MLRRRLVSLGGVSTAFLDEGVGEAIVALHGVPTSSALFEPLLPHLRRYRLLAPDLIGHGDTETPRSGRLDHAVYKAHLDSFLATVPPPEFHLVVHDLGGILGLEWAADHPQRIRRVVILSTTVTSSYRVGVIVAANLLFGRGLLLRALPATTRGRVPLDASLGASWALPWTRRRVLRGMDLFAAKHLARLRSKLQRIHAPVLLIWGDEDDIFPVACARRIAENLPQSKLVTIARCGHWSPIDAAEEVARNVVEFLGAAPCLGTGRG